MSDILSKQDSNFLLSTIRIPNLTGLIRYILRNKKNDFIFIKQTPIVINLYTKLKFT